MLDFKTDQSVAAHDAALLASLLGAQALCTSEADSALACAKRLHVPLADVLLRHCGMSPDLIARHQAIVFGTKVIDPARLPPDPALIAKIGAQTCLRHGLLPWRVVDDRVVILTARPDQFATVQLDLAKVFGQSSMALTTEAQVATTVVNHDGTAMATDAATSVSERDSCRLWNARCVAGIAASGTLMLAVCGFLVPGGLIIALTLWATGALAATTFLKVGAAITGFRSGTKPPRPVAEADLPVITVLVPLYREKAIASHLLVRLAALRYPRALLDICLVLEEDDATTRATLARTTLPGWMRAISVPPGKVRTKPRALNYALPFARGSIIGVWDAEDAPAPDQLHVVARYFATAAPQVACLQGVLDYYNTSTNWLTRCFAIEYAAWFRVVLPGLARLGLVVPLGGTTLFFRRDMLEKLGAWDAYNVTEDADLGLRLARHGYTTVLIPTVTMEEANGRAWPWVKQRARWIKGYAITYFVHMRDPMHLLRDLGLWRFCGVQVLFLGTLSLSVLMPLFWSLWLVPLGVAHPFQVWLGPGLFQTVVIAFIGSEILAFGVNLIGLSRAGKLRLWGWALSLPLYFPMAVLAAYRGLAELVTRPFFWDKTAHGIVMSGLKPQITLPPRPPQHPVSTE